MDWAGHSVVFRSSDAKMGKPALTMGQAVFTVGKGRRVSAMQRITCNGTVPCVRDIIGKQIYYIPYEYESIIGPEKWWKTVDKAPLLAMATSFWYLSIPIALFYSFGVHFLQRFMADRPAFELKRPLIIWNACLAVFSLIGFIRLLEEFRFVLNTRPMVDSISYALDMDQPSTFWAVCFAVSKVFELVDTLFVVLRKKPLIFLHWFHHAAVVVYCAHSATDAVAATRWFMVMNYGVHSIMYTYFSISATGYRFSRGISKIITAMQTTQMFIGVAISFMCCYLKLQGEIVQQSYENMALTFAIYALLAVLFTTFYGEAYGFGRKKTKTQ